MKKMLSVLLALAMVFSLSCTAFAVEEVEYEPSTEETIITPRSSLSLSFTSLQTNSKKLSSETYYISNEDAKPHAHERMVLEYHKPRHKNGRLEEGSQAQSDDLPRPAGKAVQITARHAEHIE